MARTHRACRLSDETADARSGAPVVHVLLFGLVLGYGLNYNHIYHSTHPHEGEHH